MRSLALFVRESNAIEGIRRHPTEAEIRAHADFLRAPEVTVEALERLVAICQPGAELRRRVGMDVRVGNHVPQPGSPLIATQLHLLLGNTRMTAYARHHAYEHLHPFTDGNGRSGRALWLRDMGGIRNVPLGFLHTWYYQSLAAGSERSA